MKYIYVYCLFIATCLTFAQTDIDGIMMEKNNLCVGAVYQYSSFNKYWEGTLLRENLNIGTVSNKSITIMGNYGVTNKLNILFSIPYIKTAASAGTLKGQNGFQDFSISAKYMPLDKEINKFLVSGYILGGYSNPVSNYNPDFLPLSIGLQSNTGWLRLMTDIQRGKIYSTFSAAYIRRNNIKIDRDAYYTTEYHYTNEVFMPDAITYNFRLGYRSKYFISDVFYDNWITQKGGFDITRNNMPFPSNTMNLSKIGAYIKYNIIKIDGLSIIASYSEVITGRNVGKSTSINGGVFYVMNFNKNKKSIEK